ncbi:MAG: hypothetical protein DUD39_00525 [Coriobacteriaceae bacterium]|nr:MAG: hypothetical protein DUD39_00525 [Coriobacteriaceae bacterium]
MQRLKSSVGKYEALYSLGTISESVPTAVAIAAAGGALGPARLVCLDGHDLVEYGGHGGVHHVAQARGAV